MINVTTSALPNDVIENILFRHLSLLTLSTCSRVCRAWNKMAMSHINAFSPTEAFGPKEWYAYFGGHLRNVPRLPQGIELILSSPCPFWPGKKVRETHVLVLVPESVNGQPLTLKTMGELVQKPLQGHATKYSYCELGKYVDHPAPSHWALLTRTVIEGSRSKRYEDEQAILAQYNQKTKIVYEIPTVLDATVCNFMEYVRSGTWLYGDNPLTYTWCQEKYDANSHLVVGGGSASGLDVNDFHDAYEHYGVGGFRKL